MVLLLTNMDLEFMKMGASLRIVQMIDCRVLVPSTIASCPYGLLQKLKLICDASAGYIALHDLQAQLCNVWQKAACFPGRNEWISSLCGAWYYSAWSKIGCCWNAACVEGLVN